VCGKTKKGKRSHEKQTKTLPQLFNIQGLILPTMLREMSSIRKMVGTQKILTLKMLVGRTSRKSVLTHLLEIVWQLQQVFQPQKLMNDVILKMRFFHLGKFKWKGEIPI
jgi:hypothetical protein